MFLNFIDSFLPQGTNKYKGVRLNVNKRGEGVIDNLAEM